MPGIGPRTQWYNGPMVVPAKIEKIGDEALRILWEDGGESRYAFRDLRLACPCALCKDEWSGKPLIDPAKVPADLKAGRAELIGNYALAFAFSDGHSTGVYTFQLLRELGR